MFYSPLEDFSWPFRYFSFSLMQMIFVPSKNKIVQGIYGNQFILTNNDFECHISWSSDHKIGAFMSVKESLHGSGFIMKAAYRCAYAWGLRRRSFEREYRLKIWKRTLEIINVRHVSLLATNKWKDQNI